MLTGWREAACPQGEVSSGLKAWLEVGDGQKPTNFPILTALRAYGTLGLGLETAGLLARERLD